MKESKFILFEPLYTIHCASKLYMNRSVSSDNTRDVKQLKHQQLDQSAIRFVRLILGHSEQLHENLGTNKQTNIYSTERRNWAVEKGKKYKAMLWRPIQNSAEPWPESQKSRSPGSQKSRNLVTVKSHWLSEKQASQWRGSEPMS